MRMRLQKFMADAGVDSRRKCEELIVRGLVQVNGERAELGRVVDPAQDVVTYAGRAALHRTEALGLGVQ